VGAGKQGSGREAVCEYPYPTAVLLRRLAEEKEGWSGSATCGRSSSMACGGEARGARASRQEAAAAAWG
jgi:hypothetical protein